MMTAECCYSLHRCCSFWASLPRPPLISQSRESVMFKQLLYRLYEGRLLQEVRGGELPRHIGLILDGNRRYARERGYSTLLEGHRRGAEKLEEVLNWCEELAIGMVTVWIFSTENVSRSQEEVDGLLGLIEKKMRDIARDPKVHRKQMRIRARSEEHTSELQSPLNLV